jgi:hypothetical protein
MPSVVADANVLISAALARSPNAPSVLILDAALDGRLELITHRLCCARSPTSSPDPASANTSPPTKRSAS